MLSTQITEHNVGRKDNPSWKRSITRVLVKESQTTELGRPSSHTSLSCWHKVFRHMHSICSSMQLLARPSLQQQLALRLAGCMLGSLCTLHID